MARTKNAVVATSAAVSPVQAYVAALLDIQGLNLNANAMAFDLLSECKTVEALVVVRDGFKGEYIAQYTVRNGASTDAEKAKNAANMAWSRTVAKATELGFDKPVAETEGAKKARESRKAASEGKIDGRTTKKGEKVTGIVCEDADLREAFARIMADEALEEKFFAWFDEATAVKVTQVRGGRKVA